MLPNVEEILTFLWCNKSHSRGLRGIFEYESNNRQRLDLVVLPGGMSVQAGSVTHTCHAVRRQRQARTINPKRAGSTTFGNAHGQILLAISMVTKTAAVVLLLIVVHNPLLRCGFCVAIFKRKKNTTNRTYVVWLGPSFSGGLCGIAVVVSWLQGKGTSTARVEEGCNHGVP